MSHPRETSGRGTLRGVGSSRRWCTSPTMLPVALIAVLLLLTGCATHDSTSTAVTHDFGGRVDTTTNSLLLDGSPWQPVGFNAYQLGTDWSVNRGCGAEVDLDRYFSALPARSLTRFNLYASFAVSVTTGGLDFAPLDAVFAAAERHHQMVLPVLTGSSGACEDNQFKDRQWYVYGWRTTPHVGGLTYAQWLPIAVKRWAGRTSLAGWELVGEPEASSCGAGGCAWQQRLCAPGAAQVLRDFFDSAGAQLREIDDRHPIFSGTTGGDQCSLAGDDILTVGASPNIDILDYHDYRYDDGAPPAGSDLPTRLSQSRQLGKPLVVTELGMKAGSCRTLQERYDTLREQTLTERRSGVAAILFWAFVPDPRPTECTYDIGFDDPLWQVVSDLNR